MPIHNGFMAAIVDEASQLPLEEYRPTLDPTTNIVTCYVETKLNQPFTIVLRDTTSVFSQGTSVYVDGIYVDNGLTGPGIAIERRWFGKRIDQIHVKPFIFGHNPAGTPR